MEIFFRALNAFLMIALPLILGVYLVRRYDVEWRLFGIGVMLFVGSQFLHIPFNAWVLSPGIEKLGLSDASAGMPLVGLAILYGLSAGLFEEVARYIGFRFWLKEDRNWGAGLMVGAGHGGIEAILLGMLALYAFIQALALRNADLASVVSPDKIAVARTQLDLYWSIPWYTALLGAVERIGAVAFHLSASVLVLQVFQRQSYLWLGAAIAWHTLLDALTVYGIRVWGVYITEGLILFFGGVSIVLVVLLRDAPRKFSPAPNLPLPPRGESDPPENWRENLDDSRYI